MKKLLKKHESYNLEIKRQEWLHTCMYLYKIGVDEIFVKKLLFEAANSNYYF